MKLLNYATGVTATLPLMKIPVVKWRGFVVDAQQISFELAKTFSIYNKKEQETFKSRFRKFGNIVTGSYETAERPILSCNAISSFLQIDWIIEEL